MNNLVEAPLDDKYSTATGRKYWVDYHTFSDEAMIDACALSLSLCEQISSQDPLTEGAIEQDHEFKIDQAVRRLEVQHLKEEVIYAFGKLPWDIHQSKS